jgi:hypothetical protein
MSTAARTLPFPPIYITCRSDSPTGREHKLAAPRARFILGDFPKTLRKDTAYAWRSFTRFALFLHWASESAEWAVSEFWSGYLVARQRAPMVAVEAAQRCLIDRRGWYRNEILALQPRDAILALDEGEAALEATLSTRLQLRRIAHGRRIVAHDTGVNASSASASAPIAYARRILR